MTLEQLLELGLSEEIAKKVIEAHQAAIKDNYVPLARFNEVNEEKKQYKEQVDNLNKELGKLQKQLEDNQDATKTIEDLQKQIKDKEEEMARIRKQNAIKFEVLKANPHDVADILPHLKDDQIVLSEDGTITGLQEQLEALKESKPYLFKQEEPQGTGGSLGAGSKPKGSLTITKEEFKKMGYLERLKLKQENEELYNQLIK